MNKQTVKKQIEVMQAYVDGKEIQVFLAGEWRNCHDRMRFFDFDGRDFRVKPEPREWYLCLEHPVHGLISTAEKPDTFHTIKVREVLEG